MIFLTSKNPFQNADQIVVSIMENVIVINKLFFCAPKIVTVDQCNRIILIRVGIMKVDEFKEDYIIFVQAVFDLFKKQSEGVDDLMSFVFGPLLLKFKLIALECLK